MTDLGQLRQDPGEDSGSGTGRSDPEVFWADSVLSYPPVHRGDILEGVVMHIDQDGILVDIGQKTEGVVPGHELHNLSREDLDEITPGSEITVYVLQPENDEGQVVLSLARARGERGWRTLQKYLETGETFEAEVVDYNKGGLIVNVESVPAFVPSSQVVSLRADGEPVEDPEQKLASSVGKKLRVKVIELNRRRNRAILSERLALQEWRSQQKERLIEELREGEVRKGRVTSIRNFGAFVDLGGADGLIHLSELSWEPVRDPSEVLHVGDEVEVYVMKVDLATKRISLSLRRRQPEPWQDIAERFQVGQIVTGTITKLTNFGAFARIEGGIEGLIHVSELTERRIAHPKEVIEEGDTVPLKILKVEPERHRVGLSLKQAREELGTS